MQAAHPFDPSKPIIVKFFCTPNFESPATSVPGGLVRCQSSQQGIPRRVQMIQTVQALAQDCGMGEVVPRAWVGRVDAVIPQVGYHAR